MDEPIKTNPPVEKSELEKAQKQAEEYLNGWKRAQADFINYKKDEAKRLEEIMKFANEGLVLEIVEVMDDLELARQNFEKQNLGGQAVGDINNRGLNQIIKKMLELLNKYGVEKIKAAGNFDPLLHEAVSTEPDGTKLEEIRSGYTMHGKVIRPARVSIKK